MPKKLPLNSAHYDILRTIKKFQPCGSNLIAKKLGLKPNNVRSKIFYTLYARGLIGTELLTKSKRKPGTIHLTKAGEDLINEHQGN